MLPSNFVSIQIWCFIVNHGVCLVGWVLTLKFVIGKVVFFWIERGFFEYKAEPIGEYAEMNCHRGRLFDFDVTKQKSPAAIIQRGFFIG